MGIPWEDPNKDDPPGYVSVDSVIKTLQAAHAAHAIQDIVVVFTFYDPETGYKSVFRNVSQMPPVEMIGMLESTKMLMAYRLFEGKSSL